MKKFFFLLLFCGFVAGLFAAETKYISPNNDGIQDELVVNFKVKDKSKIFGWALVIEDAKGQKIRTIGNKIALPTEFSGENLRKQLAKKKVSIEVPPTVKWNGAMENGETAPDGEYFYYIEATDERKNTTKAAPATVFVKNTPPSVVLDVLPEGQRIFGEGEKITFKVGQSGTTEDLWKATIQDASGKVVRNYSWKNSAPQSFEWNGTDDKGVIVYDGVYKYSITATDRAGNTNAPAEVANIVFSAEKPAVNVMVLGSRYFSVPEKSKIDSVKLGVTIPEARKGSGNALVNWGVEIVDNGGKVVRSCKGKRGDVPPEEIVFEGKNDKGAKVPDGEYYARVYAEYLNGYKTPVMNSPSFVLDTSAPAATIDSYEEVFSPDGDGQKDLFVLEQTAVKEGGAPVKNWKGLILKAGTTDIVYEYNFSGKLPPKKIEWSGLDMNGNICADGKYEYELSAEDMAGNSFSVKTKSPFSLDTSKTEVMLTASEWAFNPNGKRSDVAYTSVLKSTSVSEYNFEIKNKSGVVVYSQKANGNVPQKIVWNGKSSAGILCEDGPYFASVSIVSANGSSARAEAHPVEIDTVPPSVEISLPYKVFSPDGTSKKSALKFTTENSTKEREWRAEILDSKSNVVKTFDWEEYVAGKVNSQFEWNGTDDNGNKAKDGTYSFAISAEDAAGNSFSKKIDSIVLDTRAATAILTAALPGFSPISTTGLTEQKFSVRLSLNEAIESWSFDIKNSAGKTVRSLATGAAAIPAQIVWDGKDADGNDCEGNFTANLSVNYVKGNLVETKTPPFICSVTPPALTVKTLPEFFSPDNDGIDDDCFITLTEKDTSKLANWSFVIGYPESSGRKTAFWKTSGADKITPQLTWDGLSNTNREKDGKAERVQSAMDYPYTFTAIDSLGMKSVVSGIIPVDILVIREGDALKMAVPSIIFRSNAADFKTAAEATGSKVTAEQAANNVRVLKRVSEILKKFPDYTVTVVGHANKTGAAGEDDILLRLSDERAAFVRNWLVKNGGIPEKRLSSEGKGASMPVAAFEDTANWWKNRRVEFILHK